MNAKRLALIMGGLSMLIASMAYAQDRTSGAVRGVITDRASGEPVIGAMVVVTAPVLQGSQAEITDASGSYFISNLPPGIYQMTVYHAESETRRGNVLVQLGKVSVVNLPIDMEIKEGEVIEIQGRAPVIDQGSTKTGRTITEDFTRNIPTGSTFGAVLGSAAGAQDDLYGISFGGATSAENIYIIEGINTTDPAFGLQSTNLPNEFIQETEIITGGYSAEYGRSTGGVVNVLTKSGSNELHGSVFTYFTPGFLVAEEQGISEAGSAIGAKEELRYDMSLGGELGGPILRDTLWFHVGVNPSVQGNRTHRIIQTLVDANDDGEPDLDPGTGFPILREVGRTTYTNGHRTTFFTAKLSGAIAPEHQGSLSFFGNPSTRELFRDTADTRKPEVTGTESATRLRETLGAWDVAGKWTSKLNNNKTQLDAVAGWHRNVNRDYPGAEGGDSPRFRVSLSRPLSYYAQYEPGGIPAECRDSDNKEEDPYPNIVNCPVVNYRTGGIGLRELETTDRISAVLSLTQRVNAIGQHIFKTGIDFEHQIYDRVSSFTGGQAYIRRFSFEEDVWQIDRWYSFIDPASPYVQENRGVAEMCEVPGVGMVSCVYWPEGLPSTTSTRNVAAYLQDSWQILPHLTANAGLRWELQSVRSAEQVAGMLSPVTMEPFSDVAFRISDMFAPRLGVIYDPTREGRSKVFAHWGRFYESIPMDINTRAFGGEVYNRNFVGIDDGDATKCPERLNENNAAECDVTEAGVGRRQFVGGGQTLVTPGIKGQYLDELVLGGEYELLNDFKVGASFIHRALGRAIEDLSTDGGFTYFIANPGEVNEAEIARLRREGREAEAELFAAAKDFDEPTRVYDALQLTAEKRFDRDLMVLASYTLSRLHGNFPGLFSPETGQLDPNLTSMYDLPELMANRTGPLAADRTHLFKLDGFYQLDLDAIGYLVFGSGIRVTSGIPHNYLGSHPLYGAQETYILPRGTAPRSPLLTQVDVRVQYGRQIDRGMRIEAFLDVFNLFNRQSGVNTDDEYTPNNVNPIVGGTAEDLAHLKIAGSSQLAAKNPNFGNINARQRPLSMRFGLRFTF